MSRRDIHYWKCDRPAAFHGTGPRPCGDEVSEESIRFALEESFHPDKLTLSPATGQGNHLTWNAEIDGVPAFLRIENGPEGDDYLEMESALLGEVAKAGVPVPQVLGSDASRSLVPFAWQALERIPHPDLNHWWKNGLLDEPAVAYQIGAAVARWQSVPMESFGPFQLEVWRKERVLRGFHHRYAGYFTLNLARHLKFLVKDNFLSRSEAEEIASLIESHTGLLEDFEPCLVHKDLALWNVLGEPDLIAAFIDFDDAIGGDPCDDLSLLACFHDAAFLALAVAGYASLRPLPDRFLPRFWLHLLRNMIVKAVIRAGAGYFRRDSAFFLIAEGGTGATLRQLTLDRIALAQQGLRTTSPINIL